MSEEITPQKTCCAPPRDPPCDPPALGQSAAFIRITHGSTDAMQLIPGGEFLMGNERDYGFLADGEGPVHAVKLAPFYLDETCVTNEAFNTFVNATGYHTEAEKFGWSFVFCGHLSPTLQLTTARIRVAGSEWWCRIKGASWRHPDGPGSTLKQRWSHPVVQVSWHDASAYAAWVGKRLPTEAEWECAARGGLVQKKFPWGDDLEPDGKHRMNVWQGIFFTQNIGADGYYGTAPAKSFRANAYRLYNMTGNVWEWCWDYSDTAYYRASPFENPTGPAIGERRVMRGGSYLCHASYCNRYRTDARSSNTPESGTTNLGFRCARDV